MELDVIVESFLMLVMGVLYLDGSHAWIIEIIMVKRKFLTGTVTVGIRAKVYK